MNLTTILTTAAYAAMMGWESTQPEELYSVFQDSSIEDQQILGVYAYYENGTLFGNATFEAVDNVATWIATKSAILDEQWGAPSGPDADVYSVDIEALSLQPVDADAADVTSLNLVKRAPSDCGRFCGTGVHCRNKCKKCRIFPSGVNGWWKHCV